MFCISQENLKNIYLTDKDSTKVTVNYKYIVATRMLYKDYCGLKKVENQQLYTIQQQNKQILSLVKENTFLAENDSILKRKNSVDSLLLDNCKKQLFDTRYNLKKEKISKIGLSITLPIVAILTFLTGFYLAK